MSTNPAPKLPLATWLVPVLGILLVGAFLSFGQPTVTPAPPPPLRTPEGKTVTPGDAPVASAEGEAAAPATDPAAADDVTGPGPVPVAPIYAGAALITDTPYWRYRLEGADFVAVRDYYVGYFGKDIQYAESVVPATGRKRAICFRSNAPEAVQISETDEAGVLEIAIGPIARLQAAP